MLVPRLGVDGKQYSYLHQDPRRDEVLLVEFDRFVELAPGMGATSRLISALLRRTTNNPVSTLMNRAHHKHYRSKSCVAMRLRLFRHLARRGLPVGQTEPSRVPQRPVQWIHYSWHELELWVQPEKDVFHRVPHIRDMLQN